MSESEEILELELKQLREKKSRLRTHLEWATNVRDAASRGDWNEFDRIIGGFYDGIGVYSGGTEAEGDGTAGEEESAR